MRQLHDQHTDEVQELRMEIERLRATAGVPGTLAAVAPPTGEVAEGASAPETSEAAEEPATPKKRNSSVVAAQMVPSASSGKAIGRGTSFCDVHNRAVGEPTAKDWRAALRQAVETHFDMCIGGVIIVNIIFIYVELERSGHEAGSAIGATSGGDWANQDVLFAVIANIFTAIFLLELLLKLVVYRGAFFFALGRLQKFNIFDSIIVVASVVDLWFVSPSMGPRSSGSSLQVIRLFRFVRVLRTLRVVRIFEVFAKLRVLVATSIASFFSLFWSLVLLSIVMLMAALVLCHSINLILLDASVALELKLDLFRYLGTPSRSLWTVFDITFGGGWQKHARPLVEEVSFLWAAFFVVYIAGVIFAMFKIITALFIKDTTTVATLDAEAVIRDKMKEKARYAQKLHDVFVAADSSGDGCVTRAEFNELLMDDTACA